MDISTKPILGKNIVPGMIIKIACYGVIFVFELVKADSTALTFLVLLPNGEVVSYWFSIERIYEQFC